MVKLVMKEGVS
jgi:transposase